MYSVKVTHNGEVRRTQVVLDGIVTTAYDQLIQTVRNIFPDLSLSRSFCLTWQDDEGDVVTVSSEMELTEAIRVMSSMYGGNALRFTVKKLEGQAAASSAAGQSSVPVSPFIAGGDRIAAAMKKEAEESIHYGVQCDECGVCPIVGIRYKCSVRHNYDLCSACFGKKTQPHPMIKIEDPVDRRGCRRGRGKCGRVDGPHHPPHGHGPPHHHLHGGPHHPHHPHRGGHRGGRGGGGMFHWFGAAPGEGIPYEGCEDYYGPCDYEGEEGNEATGATAEEKKNAAGVPPGPPRGPFGGPHPYPQHPPFMHGGLFGGRGPHPHGPFGGRGGPPHGPWGGRGHGWFGAGPVVVEADLYVDTPTANAKEGTTAVPPTAAADKEGTVVHTGVTCDVCGASPIKGIRYKCTVRNNFDVCATCYESEIQPYPMLKIVTSGGEGTVITPGAPVMRDLNDEDAGLQAAISESMAKVSLGNSTVSATSATEEEVEEVYSEDSFTFVAPETAAAAPAPTAAAAPAPTAAAAPAPTAAEIEQAALVKLWAKELSILSDMGFTDSAELIPLLQQNVVIPASQAGENNAVQSVRAVEGMQSVVATLLLGQSGIRR